MDDRQLAELLRAAAPEQVPAARFDHADVVASSRRAAARRARVLLGSAAASVVVVLAAAVAVLGGAQGGQEGTASSAQEGQAAAAAQESCGPADPQVYGALAQVLPDLAVQEPFPLAIPCPAGVTGAGVLVAGGTLEVTVTPPGTTAPPRGTGLAARGPSASAETADRRTLTLQSVPGVTGGPPPYESELGVLAEELAAALG